MQFVNLAEKLDHVAGEFREVVIVAGNALHVELQASGQARIEAHEVAPLAARDPEIALRLRDMLGIHAMQQRFDVRERGRTLDLYDAVTAYFSVNAAAAHLDRRMMPEARLRHHSSGARLVGHA